LHTIVAVARTLIGTSAAYISRPERDGSEFLFTNLLNIRTSAFKRLRMGPGAGLGGLAREELRAVRTLNYAEDTRLRNAPIEETLGEGFHSAMCAPLLASGGGLIGLLYASNRTPTPFTESDTAVLDEFASFAALSLQQAEVQQQRISVMRRLEQERLAFELHDSLVRDLVEIGFTAEAGLAVASESHVRNQLEAIGRTAEVCLEKIRDEITRMANDGGLAESASVGEVLEELRCMHSHGRIERSFVVSGATRSTLPAAVANALVRIGQETIENAERHSDASRVEVALVIGSEVATIRISDNGRGMSGELLETSTSEHSPHLGLRRMRGIARRLNGSLSILRPEGGGLAVEAHIPLSPEVRV
jgi:signal transduction histidine kinase